MAERLAYFRAVAEAAHISAHQEAESEAAAGLSPIKAGPSDLSLY